MIILLYIKLSNVVPVRNICYLDEVDLGDAGEDSDPLQHPPHDQPAEIPGRDGHDQPAQGERHAQKHQADPATPFVGKISG